VGSRTKARECALQALYQLDTSGGSAALALAGIFAHVEEAESADKGFAEELVHGVQGERPAIDEIIQRYSTNWKLDRMARVDRNILRLGVFELLRRGDVPVKVTLNEAVELGKKFGTEESSSFVNGVLDKIAHGREMATAKPKSEGPARED